MDQNNHLTIKTRVRRWYAHARSNLTTIISIRPPTNDYLTKPVGIQPNKNNLLKCTQQKLRHLTHRNKTALKLARESSEILYGTIHPTSYSTDPSVNDELQPASKLQKQGNQQSQLQYPHHKHVTSKIRNQCTKDNGYATAKCQCIINRYTSWSETRKSVYIAISENWSKARHSNHKAPFKQVTKEKGDELSRYIWKRK